MPGQTDPFHRAVNEAYARPLRVKPIEVIDALPLADGDAPFIGAPGTITVFVAKAGSGALDEVRETASGSRDRRRQLAKRLRGPDPDRDIDPVSPDLTAREFALLVSQAPVFADIRYGGEVVNRGIFVPPGSDLALTILPYNGGRLSREGFRLAEHYLEDSDIELEALAVRHMPPLTRAERAAVNQVPGDQLEKNVGSALSCKTTWWGIAAAVAVQVVVRAVVYTAMVTCARVADEDEPRLEDDELQRLGPHASARRLLAMRRDALLQASQRR